MTEIVRNRTIRPSTRLETSRSYRIDTKQVSHGDSLVVNIDHEAKPFRKTYKFNSGDLEHKNSISFRVNEFETSIDITWSGAQPTCESCKTDICQTRKKPKTEKLATKTSSKDLKKSFDPISNSDTSVLILGTMPGDKSLELNEYYGHPRNRFWKIISFITDNDLPLTYTEKRALLLKTKIGIWDVARKAVRKGSLDCAIRDEGPNDLDNFISKHKNLKVIGFNGKKSEEFFFNKHFTRKKEIKYILLPSTSPANARMDCENICKEWRQILTK